MTVRPKMLKSMFSESVCFSYSLLAGGKVIESQVRKNVQAGIQTFAWDGTAGGKTMPAGTYGLRITAVNGGKPVDATALTAATVEAALKTSSGTSLQLGGLGSRPLSDVRGVL